MPICVCEPSVTDDDDDDDDCNCWIIVTSLFKESNRSSRLCISWPVSRIFCCARPRDKHSILLFPITSFFFDSLCDLPTIDLDSFKMFFVSLTTDIHWLRSVIGSLVFVKSQTCFIFSCVLFVGVLVNVPGGRLRNSLKINVFLHLESLLFNNP
ncbi:hypothetical protein WICPIJ_006079 [Wickerhamomyces pijperi]|uniref:Uncharacterized protein n=1 Tax=Wickerhamomyces pijperi TaxID=599730 RepID=A0A9P8Q528_WICPI|nr:hypothetical protein WICPIJ_006079 [Wickerhamomyces pijperi]